MTKNDLSVDRIIKKKKPLVKDEIIEMFPYGLVQGLSQVKPIFLLSDKDDKDFLPVWVDMMELESLSHYFQDNPMTGHHPYQTHIEILEGLGWKVDRLVFKKLDGYRLYGELIVTNGVEEKVFDRRAESIVLLALYSGAKLFAHTSVIEQSKEIKDLDQLKVIDIDLEDYKKQQDYLM